MSSRSDKLDSLQIAVPCSTDWDQMVGSDRIRYCSECSKNVYDISRMSRNEAEALVSSARDGGLCLRLVRDAYGSTVTEATFTGLRIAGRKVSPVAVAVVTAIMGIGGSAIATAPARANSASASYYDSVAAKARGQADPSDSTSTLEGSVLDPNQAVIAGAKVMVRNEVTGDVRGTTSSASGAFSFQTLKPGSYTMVAQAAGFSLQQMSGVRVNANQSIKVAVTMRAAEQQVISVGKVGPAPQPLRSLYNKNALIVVARVGASKKMERDGSAMLMKTALTISRTLKGQTRKPTIYVYHWTYGEDAEQQFVIGNDLLLFLRRREDRITHKVQDGYEVEYPGFGIKKLSSAELDVYVARIKELEEIEQPDIDSPEIAEWLVRCAEEPATRWEGTSELAWSAWRLVRAEQDQKDKADAGKSENAGALSLAPIAGSLAVEKSAEETEATLEIEESKTLLISMLTARQKERLAGALYATVAVSERERELIEIEKGLKDSRLLGFLIAQLHMFETDPPEFVETIVNDVAELMGDEEVNKFLEESENASIADDESDETAGEEEDATENESAEAEADRVAAETARRRIMLQKFLLLVEKKLNGPANQRSGASASSLNSAR